MAGAGSKPAGAAGASQLKPGAGAASSAAGAKASVVGGSSVGAKEEKKGA